MSQQDKAKLEYAIKMFTEAVTRLDEALVIKPEGEHSLVIDASIQRFEFSFEMSWKTLKRFLEYKGLEAKSPRDCFKMAFKAGWLTNDDLWSQMIEDRNRTSHTYDKKIAHAVYGNLVRYLEAFKELRGRLMGIVQSI